MRQTVFFMTFLVSILAAKAGDCLTFKTSDGQTQSLEIGDGLILSIDGTFLTIGNVSFTLSDLSKMYFTESVSIGETGWATYSSSKNLDYAAASGLTVYSAQFDDNTGTISLTEQSDAVPGGEGVVVSASSGIYYVPVVTAANALSGNDLIGTCSTEVTAKGSNYYALASVGDNVGFCKVGSGVTIPVNKAFYIADNGSEARYMITDKTTTIDKMQTYVSDTSDKIFDLLGCKVQKDQMRSGQIYIVKTKSGTHIILPHKVCHRRGR